MPLPEILKQRLIENAQAVADKKVMVLWKQPQKHLISMCTCISVQDLFSLFSSPSSLLILLSPKSLMSIVTALLKQTQPQQGKEAPCL